ncbi:MAG: DNA mismatch repair protein MutS [Tannerella sp.]|jgi:DNA mismatch repair ATPase MutS|nr:DNA mismatch repair protein MutS [Tannerella sp.]
MEQKTTIDEIFLFYRTKQKEHSDILQTLKRNIHNTGTLRLLVIIGMIVTLWLCRGYSVTALMAVAAAFLLPFFVLVVYHTGLHAKRAYEEGVIRLCENELKALNYDFSAFDGAAELTDSQHPFSLDLDVFGEKSLFQSINRTVTLIGKKRLAGWFKNPLSNKPDILSRQQAVKEMCTKTDFRHNFYVTGKEQPNSDKDVRQLNELASRTTHFSENLLWKALIWLVPLAWIITIAALIWTNMSFGAFNVMFFLSLIIANIHTKRITKLHQTMDHMNKMLSVYSKLMKHIENEKFNSDTLKNSQQKLTSNGAAASKTIKKLSGIIGGLDQRFNMAAIIFNLLYLRDLRHVMQLEKWVKTYAGRFDTWFDALAEFDAFCSLANFTFNHPGYIFPSIADTYCQMEGKALGHPLIHRDKCVRNDIDIPGNKYFLIVTGANMAGKSTYLRTIGVNFLFACMGMPVCAESLSVYPAHLVTSLRTADSLVSNESYFFAELKRLKMIIDLLNTGRELFIILDEILKGTNSIDKQKGSVALVKQLLKKGACGMIATHDLTLGSLTEIFPENIRNKRFEADITNDKLTFTYRIREGIAQNMNATFLMKKMGISEDE